MFHLFTIAVNTKKGKRIVLYSKKHSFCRCASPRTIYHKSVRMVKEDRTHRASAAVKAAGKPTKGTMAHYNAQRELMKSDGTSPVKEEKSESSVSSKPLVMKKLFLEDELVAVSFTNAIDIYPLLKGSAYGLNPAGKNVKIPANIATYIGPPKNKEIGPSFFENYLPRCVYTIYYIIALNMFTGTIMAPFPCILLGLILRGISGLFRWRNSMTSFALTLIFLHLSMS